MKGKSLLLAVVALTGSAACAAESATPETLWARYAEATNATGRVLELAAGRYQLAKPMVFTRGITVRGAADGETVIDGGDALDRLVEIVHGGDGKFLTVCYQQVADNATPCLMSVRWRLRPF